MNQQRLYPLWYRQTGDCLWCLILGGVSCLKLPKIMIAGGGDDWLTGDQWSAAVPPEPGPFSTT